MSIVFLIALFAGSWQSPSIPLCRQAPAATARTAVFEGGFAVTGAGARDLPDGGTQIVWTGTDCTASMQYRGPAIPIEAEGRIQVSSGAEFALVEERPALRLEYKLSASGASFSVNGTPVDRGPERGWLESVVREFVRRTGYDAPERAQRIAAAGGVTALLAEASEIAPLRIRLVYLSAGFAAAAPADRVSFLRDGSDLLGQGDELLGSFLLATPESWRGDSALVDTLYQAAARIDSDSVVERVLTRLTPPRTMGTVTRSLLERLIATLNTVERREYWRAALPVR